MRAWMAFLATLTATACGFSSPDNGDGGMGDDDADNSAARCFGSIAMVKVCFNTVADVPTTPPPLNGATVEINTTDDPACNAKNDRPEFCVIAGPDLALQNSHGIRGYGTRPLVLLSTTTLVIEEGGMVDVRSTTDSNPELIDDGAGASPPTGCQTGIAATGSAGGGGGSFGGKGGNGQQGDAGDTAGTGGASFEPTALRGGCAGGTGGGDGGAGGVGGGAVALIAKTSIRIDGTINASGAGGHGGPSGATTKSGGGGGGSGGMIVVDAPTITAGVTAKVFANGGGGGQGGTIAVNPGGENGSQSTGPTVAGTGGDLTAGGQLGGHGGDGSSGDSLIGQPGTNPSLGTAGGGAGGGGAGFIRAPMIPEQQIAPPSKSL